MNRFVCLTTLLVGTSSLAGAAALPLERAAHLFGARPTASSVSLSPKGDEIVFVQPLEGPASVVRVLNLKTKQVKNLASSSGKPENIDWCEFASEDWLVCHFSGNFRFQGKIVGMNRLVAMNIVTNQLQRLGIPSKENDFGMQQSDGYVIAYANNGAAAVVMGRRYPLSSSTVNVPTDDGSSSALGIDRISLDTMKVTQVEPARPGIDFLLTDRDGNPRVMESAAYTDQGTLSGISGYRFRTADSIKWLPLVSYDSKKETGAFPVAFDASSDSVYLMGKQNGRDAVFTRKLAPFAPMTLLASNPQYDIDGLVRLNRGGPIIGYTYSDERPRVTYFDRAYEQLSQELHKALPDASLIDFAGASADERQLLVHAGSDRDAGAYYVFDKQTKSLEFQLNDRNELVQTPLAPVRAINIPTADGHSIPGYLTVAAGAPPNGPAIVLPHGGPSARDQWGFDWLAQFLASRGYAVIQPNYRGSAGFGKDFLGKNAFKDWRLAMSDIEASADYLTKQGIADPHRMAIVGWSYGGYAALQSAALAPDRYRAVVAIAPVTDLLALRADAAGFVGADLTKDMLGAAGNLRDGSPIRRADAIKAPVLLVAGDMDSNVNVAHSEKMEKALKKSGKQVELLEFKGLDHYLEDGDARYQMLLKMGALLERTIG